MHLLELMVKLANQLPYQNSNELDQDIKLAMQEGNSAYIKLRMDGGKYHPNERAVTTY